MGSSQLSGRLGEERAVVHLESCGYKILERNWRLGHKEADIICADEKYLVIVEVKTRSQEDFRPDELLDYKKRRNLLRIGAAYLKLKNLKQELRFDLIVIVGADLRVVHIPEAIQVFDV